MISYAQNFEDVTLWRALRDVADGRYVDVGTLHPEIDSVTKWFYDQGWSGINMEPVPEMFAVIEAARPRDINIQAAAGAAAGVAEMAVVHDSMGLSSLDISAVSANVNFPYNLVEVEIQPLRDVLEPFAGQDIHFLEDRRRRYRARCTTRDGFQPLPPLGCGSRGDGAAVANGDGGKMGRLAARGQLSARLL